jgi:hypothetical protein
MVNLWDLRSGHMKATLEQRGSDVAFEFSPDSSKLVTAASDIRLWDAATDLI